MSELKSKHAFGSEANIESAIEQGLIDEYDVLFLDEGKIGFINKNKEVVIPEGKRYVVFVDSLPESGDSEVVYICNQKFYYWDGSDFVSPSGSGDVSDAVIEEKISSAKTEAIESANAYTDEKLASVGHAVVEF